MSALKASAITLGFLILAGAAPLGAEPFTPFAGTWSGSGTITVQDGSRERLRCRGRFIAGGGGVTLNMALRCASDSYKFELSSDIAYEGGNISGSWSEVSRQVYGSLSGRMSGNRIEASAVAAGFNASLSLIARGSSQQVSIKSPGSEISEVSISLARGGR
jgi:hypothetical protein